MTPSLRVFLLSAALALCAAAGFRILTVGFRPGLLIVALAVVVIVAITARAQTAKESGLG